MKPIYFPFTYISEPVLHALHACFGKIVVYGFSEQDVPEKMRKWAENGKLDISMPVKMDEEKFALIIKDYRTWTNLHHMHRGGQIAYLKNHGQNIPFFNDFATSQIKWDIKKRGMEMHPKEDGQENVDSLSAAGIFLYLAGEYDMQDDEVSAGLHSVGEMEKNLISEMKGENDTVFMAPSKNLKPLSADTGHFMTSERIAAWTYMMQHDREVPGFFITSSRAVFEHLIDNTTEAEMALNFDSIPLDKNRIGEMDNWRDRLLDYIGILLKNTWPISHDSPGDPPFDNKCDIKASLMLYIMPGKTPHEFFAPFTGHGMFRLEKEKGDAALKNTIIGLLEITSHT